MVITLIIVAVVSAATVTGVVGWYQSRDNKEVEENVNGIIDAYHDWYSVNASKIISYSAEEALYDFVVSDTGISSYDYKNLNFNYVFKSTKVDGKEVNNAYLLYKIENFSCSIALDLKKFTNENDIEKYTLGYTDSAYAVVSKDYSSVLANLGIEEYQTVLGVKNDKIGRKVIKLNITHEQKDEFGKNLVDEIYVRPSKAVQTQDFNKVEYDLGNENFVAQLHAKANNQDIPFLNGCSFDIDSNAEAEEFVKNATVDGYESTSDVVIFGDEDFTFTDGKINDNNLSQYGAVIKFKKLEKNVTKDETYHYERSLVYNRRIYTKQPLIKVYTHLDYFPAVANPSNESAQSYGNYKSVSSSSNSSGYNYVSTYIKSFDELRESLNFIEGKDQEFKQIVNGYNGNNGLYGEYSYLGSLANPTVVYGTISTTYSNKVDVDFDDEFNWVPGQYDQFKRQTKTVVQYKDVTYHGTDKYIKFDQSSFEMYLGTATIDSYVKIPANFKVHLPFNYATVTTDSTTYGESDPINYGKNYYLNDGNAKSYSELIYNKYGNNANYRQFRETNRLTITDNGTLDLTNAKLIVGGLTLPANKNLNTKYNVGNHAAIYNNGTILLGSKGLDCFGYIYGNGLITRAKGVTQTKVQERSSILDFVSEADLNLRFASQVYGGKWPARENIGDFFSSVGGIFSDGFVNNISDFQKAFVYENSKAIWYNAAGHSMSFVKSHDYAETDKQCSMPMLMKYDASAIQCNLAINSTDKYVQKYLMFNEKYNLNYTFNYNLFGVSYGFGAKGSEDDLRAKLESAIFRVNSGTVYKSVDANGKMIFKTNNAKVVNNDNFTYWVYFESNDHYSVCGSFAPVALYNTEFNFSGDSTLEVNCSDLWVLPGSEMNFSDEARLSLGKNSAAKGYVDIWTSPYYQRTYEAHGNIACFKSNEVYNTVQTYNDPLVSYAGLEEGKINYTSRTSPSIEDNNLNSIAGTVNLTNKRFSGIFTSTTSNGGYKYVTSYMKNYGEGNLDYAKTGTSGKDYEPLVLFSKVNVL